MVKKVLIGLLVVVVGFVAFVATRPATFHIERSATVKASPATTYAQVADFHNWKDWSPWEKLDTSMKTTFAGTPGAVGSTYAWVGNDKVGEGQMTVEGATPPQSVRIKLEFLKPWKATNLTTFTFKPAGDGTTVTWAMDGNHDFMGKAMSVFMNMDQMVGKDFAKGLAELNTAAASAEDKHKAEEAAKAAAAAAAAAPPAPDGAAPAAGAAPVAVENKADAKGDPKTDAKAAPATKK